MSQGLIGGATSYEEQSINDILDDIKSWIEYTKTKKSFIEDGIKHLKNCGFWNQIPFNFQMTLLSTLTCQNTYLEDLSIVSKAIQDDRITQKEVTLLNKIGKNANDFNHEYGRTYKEEYRWRKYGDKDFEVAEQLYARGRDYFVTMQDASNASSRLQDYISTIPLITNNNINQSITGSMNILTGINNGEVNVYYNELNNFAKESEQACNAITSLEGVEQDIKDYAINLLQESKTAIEEKDEEKQNSCKKDYKGFIIGAGVKAFKVIGVLSSFASIASFFGIQI